jgi:hypothetical protein
MTNEVFVDTSYAIALANPKDHFYHQACQLADMVEANKTRMIVTHAVMLEIGNALSKQRYRKAAVKLLRSLELDPRVEIVPISEQLYARAILLYRERQDQEWRLTDFISFIVMWDRDITQVLTNNKHFQQAGFEILLR